MGADMMTIRNLKLSGTLSVILILCGCSGARSPLQANRYRNAEYGVETTFPGGIHVCIADSGGHPIGFYARLDEQTDCGRPVPDAASKISITAGYNSNFAMAPRLGLCEDGEASGGVQMDLKGLTFPNHPSVRCALKQFDGSILVYVVAQDGSWADRGVTGPEAGAALVDYVGFLHTNAQRLHADLNMFQSVLRETRLDAPDK